MSAHTRSRSVLPPVQLRQGGFLVTGASAGSGLGVRCSAVLGDELEAVFGDGDEVQHPPVVVVVGDLDQLVLVVLGDDGASGSGGPLSGLLGLLDGVDQL